jgi:alginate O-acetyltransferase complex protein AlgI
MEFVSVTYFAWLILLLSASWISSNKYSPHILTIFGIIFIFSHAPLGGLILLLESLVAYFIIHQRKRTRWIFSVFFIILIFVAFLLCKFYAKTNSIILPLGISYYTFRLIHYIQENIRKNIRIHSLIEFLAYMTFFPTFLVGPINLFPEFLTNIRRRKWDYNMFSKGLERMFYGYAQLIIVGNYLVNNLLKNKFDTVESQFNDIGILIIHSIHLWLDLYVRFSAYSSIAIGIAAMIGFKIPENFNYPFLATNIREFWNRWHISLTGWCRDYIFIPLAAITRKPFIAIGTTMITIGIWHELSIRYILWGVYHSIGISIYEKCSSINKMKKTKSKLLSKIYKIISILITILFVVMSFPITTIITNFIKSLIP